MGAIAQNFPLIIKVPWTNVFHVLKVGDDISLVDFIFYDKVLNLYLLDQKPLLYVRTKDESLLIFLILTMQVSIGFVLNYFKV